MTQFKLLTMHCGLSITEAASFLNVSENTVKSWASGRRNVRDSVLNELRALAENIAQVSDWLIDQSERESSWGLVLPQNDEDAKAIGLPCLGAAYAAIGQALAVDDLTLI